MPSDTPTDQDSPVAGPSMWREMHEQPQAIAATLALYVDGARLKPAFVDAVARWLGAGREVVIAASGSSRHAALHGKAMIEAFAGLPTSVCYASEYGLSDVEAADDPAVMVISQSGETADTLAALRRANGLGRRTLAVTNAAGSTMATQALIHLPTAAGRELAIPATKSFTTQLVVMHLVALAAAALRRTMPQAEIGPALAALGRIPGLIAAQLSQDWSVAEASAARISRASPVVYLGRDLLYGLACEGALKLKETAYVPAEAMPTGELKHGPIAMLGDSASLVVLAACDPLDPGSVHRRDKTTQLLQELALQGRDVLTIATQGDKRAPALSSRCVPTPSVDEALTPFVCIVPLQMLAFFCARDRGVDIDRPRGLTKFVAV